MDIPFPAKAAPGQASDHIAAYPAHFRSIWIKLSPNSLASYGVTEKNVHPGSWKYGSKVPIFAPLRKGGTAIRPLKQGKERMIGKADSARRSTEKNDRKIILK
ncbi:hypothetical protein GCM10022216_32640 [Sphingobacterium kyonggiense]|uniref:Uncharacterized protein n=1 Tax=Sphingobacterium kyonggiense TaxID=714075 RepID=A0ABP7Z4J5_9SPHI